MPSTSWSGCVRRELPGRRVSRNERPAHRAPDLCAVLGTVEPPDGERARCAPQASVPIEVIDGTAEHLPVADQQFDAAVISMVLCSVAEPAQALSEIQRVLRPAGELRFLEHVRADSRSLGSLQRALDATVWPLLIGGCHTHRDTEQAIRDSGLAVAELETFRFPDLRVSTQTTPHIRGIAVKPAPRAAAP